MIDLDVQDDSLRFKNPEASMELRMPVQLMSTIDYDTAKNNLLANLSHPVWLNRAPVHDGVAILCGNGPSLADTLDEIRELDGTVFACNDAAGYLLNRGIDVDYQVMMEAHEMALSEVADAKNHLFSSCVNPELFRMKPNAILWHTATPWVEDLVPRDRDDFTWVGGAICVGLFAMSICHVLGFRSIHLFGFDSSYSEGRCYASDSAVYPNRLMVNVKVGDKVFLTSYDMKEQAKHFLERRPAFEESGCKITVHGSGLLPELARTTESQPQPLTT